MAVHRSGAAVPRTSPVKEAGPPQGVGPAATPQHLPCADMRRQQAWHSGPGPAPRTKLCQPLPRLRHSRQALQQPCVAGTETQTPARLTERCAVARRICKLASFFLTRLPPPRPCRLLSPSSRRHDNGWAEPVQSLPRTGHIQFWPSQSEEEN